jgi:hypothetical protein
MVALPAHRSEVVVLIDATPRDAAATRLIESARLGKFRRSPTAWIA